MVTPSGSEVPPPPMGGQVPPPSPPYPPPHNLPMPPPVSLPSPGGPVPAPPGAFYQPAAGNPARRRRRKWWIIAVTAFVVIGGFGAYQASKTDTTSASVGACIKVTSPTLINPQTSQTPCSDPAAMYVVTETGDGSITCDTNEASYVQGSDTNNPTARVCLRYNVVAGDCIDTGAAPNSVPQKVRCSPLNPSTTVKILAVITTTSDKSQCPTGTVGLPVTKRNMVYCLG